MNSPPATGFDGRGEGVGAGVREEAVRDHLGEVLSSEAFAGAWRQQQLLSFLIERLLQGRAAELKEYNLGLEVFGRGEAFDPRLEPIVRVEASRLRSRLRKHYEAAGKDSPLRIELPRGTYVPRVTPKEPDAPAPVAEAPVEDAPLEAPAASPDPAPAAARAAFPRGRLVWAALAVIVVGAAAIAMRWSAPSAPPREPLPYSTFSRLTSEQVSCNYPSFSPDGGWVVYARREKSGWDLFVRSLATDETRNLTPDSPGDDSQPAWSPDGSQIAFRSGRSGGGIFVMPAAGGAARLIVRGGYHPAWSPDGEYLAFSLETFTDPAEGYPGRRSRLQIAEVATGDVWPAASPEAVYDAIQPAWSPNGYRIAFWGADRDGSRDIWTIPLGDGPTERVSAARVTADIWTDWSPAWSADGRYLYFASDRSGAMNLWRVRIDEVSGAVLSEPEPATTPSSYSGWGTFSRDGRRFAYGRRAVSSRLYSVGFDASRGAPAGSPGPLSGGERRVREPSVSPDGKWLVARIQDPQEDLALMRPDGGGLRRLTNDAFNDRSPAWSPDGRTIVFLSNRSGRFDLWAIRPDGTGLRRLAERGVMPVAWMPDGTLVGYPRREKPMVLAPAGAPLAQEALPGGVTPIAWSPDGRYVAGRRRGGGDALAVRGGASDELWEIPGLGVYPEVAWLPDGERFLFSRKGAIHLADVRARKSYPVLEGLSGEMHSQFALSGDGRTIYFVLSQDEEDIWIARQR